MKLFEPFDVEIDFSVNELNLYCNVRHYLEVYHIEFKYEVVDKTNSHKFIITFTSFNSAIEIENLMFEYTDRLAKEEFERFTRKYTGISKQVSGELLEKFMSEVKDEVTLETFLINNGYYDR